MLPYLKSFCLHINEKYTMKKKPKTNTVQYKVSLKGLATPSGTITFSALKSIIDILSEGSERALRLALEGESVKRGTVPLWLSASADFVLKNIKKGSTVLIFEAPTLGSVAEEQIKQPDLWNIVPSPDETAITVLSKTIADAESENLDSDNLDRGVLETLTEFKRLLNGTDLKIELTSEKRKQDAFRLDNISYQKICRIKNETSEPQAVLLTGFLNMIQHSQRRFELTTENGQTVRGKMDENSINVEQVRNLWGKKVTVKGILYYTPSKKPRFLEAEIITSKQTGDDVFNTIPIPFKARDPLLQAQSRLARHGGLVGTPEGIASEIWGKWPCDESIEELLEELKEISAEK